MLIRLEHRPAPQRLPLSYPLVTAAALAAANVGWALSTSASFDRAIEHTAFQTVALAVAWLTWKVTR